jgi:tyrosinase
MSLLATVGPTGGVKNRLDIVDFVRDEKFFTLYVRALRERFLLIIVDISLTHFRRTEAIQAKNQADYSSFFQLAGIHGLPFTTWAKPANTPTPPYESGYCTHSQILFPTWHRVYVSIYEVRF